MGWQFDRVVADSEELQKLVAELERKARELQQFALGLLDIQKRETRARNAISAD